MPLCLHFDAGGFLYQEASKLEAALNHLGPWPSLALGEGLCEVSSAAGRCWTWLVRHQPITFAIEAQGWDLSSAFLRVVMYCVIGPEDSDIVEVLFAEKAPTETERRAIPSRSSAQRTVSGFEILIWYSSFICSFHWFYGDPDWLRRRSTQALGGCKSSKFCKRCSARGGSLFVPWKTTWLCWFILGCETYTIITHQDDMKHLK